MSIHSNLLDTLIVSWRSPLSKTCPSTDYIPAQPQKKEIESLQQAVTKLSKMLTEKGLSEDDTVADFQQLRNQNN